MGTPAKPWEATQGLGSETAADNHADSAAADASQEILDENDPRLVSESLDINPDADAYAQPAPPPDGKYRAKLKLEGVKQEGTDEKKDFTSKMGKKSSLPFYSTRLSASIIDSSGKYDGITVYPAFGGSASTEARKDGSTQVTTILQRLRQPDGSPYIAPGAKKTAKEWIQLLVKALATEPEIGIETQWEASCMKCSEELKPKGEYATTTRGMHRFPAEQDGGKRKLGQTNVPELKCERNPSHGYSRARANIGRFLHLHELPKG